MSIEGISPASARWCGDLGMPAVAGPRVLAIPDDSSS
jgi:hypothetical protein